jgi:nitrite reductase (NADH) small subunit
VIRVCGVDDVPVGEGRKVVVDGHSLAIFHTPQGWYALDAACPHLAGPLADGIVGDQSVICPLHERRFDLLSGEEMGGGAMCVKSHPTRVSGADVYLRTA